MVENDHVNTDYRTDRDSVNTDWGPPGKVFCQPWALVCGEWGGRSVESKNCYTFEAVSLVGFSCPILRTIRSNYKSLSAIQSRLYSIDVVDLLKH